MQRNLWRRKLRNKNNTWVAKYILFKYWGRAWTIAWYAFLRPSLLCRGNFGRENQFWDCKVASITNHPLISMMLKNILRLIVVKNLRRLYCWNMEGKKAAYSRISTPKSKKKLERSTINISSALLLTRYL